MNYKQKMGYTAFGVVITLISMFFGAIISQPLVAQRNGGIDEIQCSKLTIVDKYGRPAIVLDITEESGNAIKIFNSGRIQRGSVICWMGKPFQD